MYFQNLRSILISVNKWQETNERELFIIRFDEYLACLGMIFIVLGLEELTGVRKQSAMVSLAAQVSVFVLILNFLKIQIINRNQKYQLSNTRIRPPIIKKRQFFLISLIFLLIILTMMIIASDIFHVPELDCFACLAFIFGGGFILIESKFGSLSNFSRIARALTIVEPDFDIHSDILRKDPDFALAVAAAINEWQYLDYSSRKMLDELENSLTEKAKRD